MVQADTLDCKQGIRTAEHCWDSSWPDATRNDANELVSDFLFGTEDEPMWDVETKQDLGLEALHCSQDCSGGLLRRKVVAFSFQCASTSTA